MVTKQMIKTGTIKTTTVVAVGLLEPQTGIGLHFPLTWLQVITSFPIKSPSTHLNLYWCGSDTSTMLLTGTGGTPQ